MILREHCIEGFVPTSGDGTLARAFENQTMNNKKKVGNEIIMHVPFCNGRRATGSL